MNLKSNFKSYYSIYICIAICIFFRIILIEEYGDYTLENEWRVLFNNLYYNKIFAYRSFDERLIPTVYMPPFYAYYIYFIKLIVQDNFDLVKSVILSQIFFSGITIFFFYKINLFFVSKKLSLFICYIFSFFPINIFSSLQISSINIQVFLNIIFLYLILNIIKGKKNKLFIILFGVLNGLIILLRGEFIIIFITSLIYLFYFKIIKLKKICLIILACIIITLPYAIRNYETFDKITITKSFGYNLWKGNNIDSTVEGSESKLAIEINNLDEKIKKIPKDKNYDFIYDQIFLEESKKFIKDNPVLFISRYLKKFLSFTFFNLKSSYPDYYNLLHIIPLIILSIMFSLSLIFSFDKKSLLYKYLVINLLTTILIFSVFFILPRYKLIIMPIQIILINIFISKILHFIHKRKSKNM